MDEEGDRLVGMKGPMLSQLMSIFVCNICKVGKYIVVRKEIMRLS
jgi:hypothetical protein